jgi:hypothetical protein
MKSATSVWQPGLYLSASQFQPLPFDEQDTKSIDAYIVHQARQEHGEEYKEARRVTNRRFPRRFGNCRTVYDRGPEWNHP